MHHATDRQNDDSRHPSLRHRFALGATFALLVGLCLAPALLAQPGAQARRGVTLYADGNFRGQSQTFYYDTASLQGGYLGQDKASSMRIDPGCEVTLYRDVDYRGSSATLYEDTADLGNTRVGNDSVSSLRIDCRRGRPGSGRPGYGGGPGHGGGPGYAGGGVTLYTGIDFRGRHETFRSDEGVLNNNAIGVETRSIEIAPGCRVTVYEHSDYRGRSTTFEQDVRDLYRTRYSGRQVGSIQVSCRQPSPGYGGDGGSYRGISLYRDEDYRGRTQHFSDHHSDLGGTNVGNDAVSSVRISEGCRAVLYTDADFRGRSTVVEYDMPSLKGTAVGNDRVTSLTIDCGNRRRR